FDARVTDLRRSLAESVSAWLGAAVTAVLRTPFFLYGSRRSISRTSSSAGSASGSAISRCPRGRCARSRQSSPSFEASDRVAFLAGAHDISVTIGPGRAAAHGLPRPFVPRHGGACPEVHMQDYSCKRCGQSFKSDRELEEHTEK